MYYSKPPLNLDEQAVLLLKRGMIGDRQFMVDRLASTNYYRLSAYWQNFVDPSTGAFKAGTRFETVWQRYAFDRRLRVTVMDAIERIEIAIRSQLVYEHAHLFGPFGYVIDRQALPGLSIEDRDTLLAYMKTELANSKETFAQHFTSKYGDCHDQLPIWMASELMTFGHMLTFFRGSPAPVKRAVAQRLEIHDKVALSWFKSLNAVRNWCAHHARLWNRVLGHTPMIPDKDPQWSSPVQISGERMFGILTILQYSLCKVAPQSQWRQRFQALLNEYPDIPKLPMGFPIGWQECPMWKDD